MAAVINTNYLSLVAQNNLNNSQSALGSAIERLSSGLRINSAKDDAAGQAIANRFTANVNGLTQAARNANDGMSIAQTTEGALNEINNNLQRIRELTVQAQNGTNSTSDLDSIQAEITQRLDEITRVSQQTQFNGVNVLASDQSLSIQVGANDSQTIDINLKQINATTLGLGTFDVTKTVDTTDIAATATTQLAPATVSVTDLSFTDTNTGSSWAVYVDDSDANKLYVSKDGGTTLYSATYNAATNSLQFDSSTSTAATATAAAGNDVHVGGGVILHADDITGRTDSNAAADPTVVLDSSGNYYVSLDGGSTFTSASVDASAGTVSYDSSTTIASGAAPSGVSSALSEVDVPGTAVNVNLSGLSSSLVGSSPTLHALKDGSGYVVEGTDTDGNSVYYKATVNATSGAVSLGDKLSEDPLASLDKALQDVDSLRSDLGAVQNRLESTVANLNNTVNNLSDARSRIQDADYATEVSNMTRAQILQQAGTAVLAQANQVPQTVLSLLR